jgi:hypothetical protein
MTIRNLNQTGRLNNLWAEHSPDFALLPMEMPDIVFGNDYLRIPGGLTENWSQRDLRKIRPENPTPD